MTLQWKNLSYFTDKNRELLESAISECRTGPSTHVHVISNLRTQSDVQGFVRNKYGDSIKFRGEDRRVDGGRYDLFFWCKCRAIVAILIATAALPCPIQRVVVDLAMRKPEPLLPRSSSQTIARPRRKITCDGCGVGSDVVDVLRSVYVDGKYCDACIDADDELSDHKWEP